MTGLGSRRSDDGHAFPVALREGDGEVEVLRTCIRCRRGQPITGFYRNSRSPDGFRPECKDCEREGRGRRHRVDEVAVLRAMAGDPPAGLTAAEKREAVRRLHRRGLDRAAIARRTGLTGDLVRYHLDTEQPRHPKTDLVIALVARNVPTKRIARELGMSPVTVRGIRAELDPDQLTTPGHGEQRASA